MKSFAAMLALSALIIKPNPPEITDQTQLTATARIAVEKGIGYMQEHIVEWNDMNDCVSCHNALPVIWSLTESKANGFTVQEGLLGDWQQKSLNMNRAIPDESLAYLLLGRNRSGSVGQYEKLAKELLDRQKPDGSWKPGGHRLLQKRRNRGSRSAATTWSAAAIASLSPQADAVSTAQDKAKKWLEAEADTEDTEVIAAEF